MRNARWLAGDDGSACWIRDAELDQAWAIAVPGNPLDPADLIGSREGVIRVVEDAHTTAERLGVAWSGRLLLWSGSGAAVGEESRNAFFDRSLATWGPVALEHFKGVVSRLAAVADHLGVRLVFRPHARHVLPDPQRCLNFLREWADAPIGLLVDPGAMLEQSMLPTVDDHLARAITALGDLADGVALTSVAQQPRSALDEDPFDGPPPEIVPLQCGVGDPARAATALQQVIREDLVVIELK